ncbi:MAG TPA: YegS/Rv2252/BmrU family lipid kinase [bacterium]|nr:YegS/Rv2252/BmrU family lipid kinase [bacterium]
MPATLIVANLRSGGGRARDALPLVTNALRRHGREYELIVTPSGEATAPLLAEFLGAGRPEFDQVAVVGGDGTLNGAVNGILTSGLSLPVGIIPCGTGNETIRALGIPKDPERAVEVLLRGQVCPIDVGRVNNRYFLNIFGLGYDVQVVKMVNMLRSRYRLARNRSIYYLAALLLLSSGFDPFEVRVQVGERVFNGRAVLVAAANGRMYGEKLLALPAPSLSDGLLDLYLLQELRSKSFRKTTRLLRHLPVPELSVQRAPSVRIQLDQRREAQVDGSLLGPSLTYDLSLLPRAIGVIHPAPPALAGQPRRPELGAERR